MQLVLSNNRVIAHGENFLAMGGVVINTETGERYERATVSECDSCPSDIDTVGYEYYAGTFVPCAPYGKGDNKGFFMEVCEKCATPRNSGIPISAFDSCVLWTNPKPLVEFEAQTIELDLTKYARLKVIVKARTPANSVCNTCELALKNVKFQLSTINLIVNTPGVGNTYYRGCEFNDEGVTFANAYTASLDVVTNSYCIPYKIIGYLHL